MSFKDKVVIITGASEGIGLATAQLLAKRGAKVVLAARRAERLAEIAKQIPGSLAVPTDVTQEAQAKNLAEKAAQKFGRIDVLINNAGLLIYKPMAEFSVEEIQRLMDVNFYGQVHCARAVLPYMTRQQSGTILNVASVAGRAGFPNLGYYCASKFALIGFSETFRQEVASKGIHVGIVNPGTVYTPMTEKILDNAKSRGKRVVYIQPKDVAETIARAIEKKERESFVPFATWALYVLHFLLPGFVEWLAWKFRASDPNAFK